MGRDFKDLPVVSSGKVGSGCEIEPCSTAMFVYPYGTFYDPDKVRSPSPSRDNHDIVVYVHTEEENRTIGSLEGIFVCSERIVLGPRELIPCRREQMPDFERKYEGRFVPFKDE